MRTGLAVFPSFPWFPLRRGPASALSRAPQAHRLALQGQQPRLIDVRDGWHLKVLQGRIWLTQPGASQDLFLGVGDTVALRQAGVLLQAEPLTPHDRWQDALALCELKRLGA